MESPDAGKKGKRSRKPMLIGFAIVAVLFLVLGAGGTFYALDRFGYVTFQGGEAAGVEAAEEVSPSPTPDAEPEPPVATPHTEDPTGEPSGEPTSAPTSAPEEDEMLLTQEDPVDISNGSWEAGRAEMNGQTYNRVLRASEGCYGGCLTWAEYNLGRNWDSFTAVVGLDDNSKSGESVTFTVYLDDEPEWRETATLGEVLEVEVDVSDSLRMRLETESEADDVLTIWADPALYGE